MYIDVKVGKPKKTRLKDPVSKRFLVEIRSLPLEFLCDGIVKCDIFGRRIVQSRLILFERSNETRLDGLR